VSTGIRTQPDPREPRARGGALFPALADPNGNRAQRRMAKRLKLRGAQAAGTTQPDLTDPATQE
jgi:hypothetical protein